MLAWLHAFCLIIFVENFCISNKTLDGERPVLMFSAAQSKYHNHQSLFKSGAFLCIAAMSTFGIDTDNFEATQNFMEIIFMLYSREIHYADSSNLSLGKHIDLQIILRIHGY